MRGSIWAPQWDGWSQVRRHLELRPWDDPQRYLRNSPLLNVKSIDAPVMLIHGDLDSTVPFTQAEEMFTALYRLNKEAVFVRYWGEGHRLAASPANVRDFYDRVFAWYDRYIGPPADVATALRDSKASDRSAHPDIRLKNRPHGV